jgi:hypothetical protein
VFLKFDPLLLQGGKVVQNSGPDPFEVSDATTMLNYLKSKKYAADRAVRVNARARKTSSRHHFSPAYGGWWDVPCPES